MNQKYYSLTELINLIDEPNRTIVSRFNQDHWPLISTVRGSSYNHQAWDGGYLDHIVDAMNNVLVCYNVLHELRPKTFSASDVLLVLYLHDIDKLWRYQKNEQGIWVRNPQFNNKEEMRPFVEQKIIDYGFVLTPEHWNGIKYVEGEKNYYSPSHRTQGPLAAFAHMFDTFSARIEYDYPLEKDDPWIGAKRGLY